MERINCIGKGRWDMKFLNKMERKLGKFAIPNLTLFIIGGYVIGYIFTLLNAEMMTWLTLNPYYILRGQVWRIFTWVLVPPSASNLLFTIIMLFFYYSLGTNLERTWGTFRYNFYIFGGMFLTVVGAFLLYLVYDLLVFGNEELVLVSIGGMTSLAQKAELYNYLFLGFSTYYINLSIFLAYAASYPDMQIMLYFIIPIKIKWMAYLDVAFLAYQIFQYLRMGILGWGGVVTIVVSLLNFIIFFLMTRNYRRISPKEVHRRNVYKRQVNQAQRISKHKCAICGRTDEDDPTLEFRFCSKCNGNYEYCQNHLFTHPHVQ